MKITIEHHATERGHLVIAACKDGRVTRVCDPALSIKQNLAAALAELRRAAGVDVQISRYARLAREANHMHVRGLKLGYLPSDFEFIERRNNYMHYARSLKAHWSALQ